MIDSTEIDRIKRQVAIADMLASRGIQPDHRNRDELLYCSPFRADANPSFSVNIRENVFRDLAAKEYRGDVIRLVSMLDGVGFATAVKTLQNFEGQTDHSPVLFLSGSSSSETPVSKDEIREVKLLNNRSLLRYVESRGIGAVIARTYLHEVHYMNKSRYLYAVGFRNDRDGYFLRNGVGCKRNIGPTDITTINGTKPGSLTANVFEGSFDFLSALQYYRLTVPTHQTFVLNSVVNLSQLLDGRLFHCTRINCYLDWDKPGRDALEKLLSQNLPVTDCSGLYCGYNDFNEYLCAQITKI